MTHPANGRTATLHDVAVHAGVSTSTASRALNGGHHVSEELLERVLSSARELSYHANEAARGLRMARTLTFGVVFQRLDSPVQLDILNGMTAGSDERGYSLLLTNARGDQDQYRLLIRRLFERRVDALFLTNPTGVREELEPFLASKVPVLTLFRRGDDLADVPLLTVRTDRAVRPAVRRLAELGHRSIAYLSTETSTRGIRPAAVENAAAEAGLRCRREVLPDGPTGESMNDLVRSITAPDVGVTAIIVAYIHLNHLMRALHNLNLSIPDDISVLSFDDSQLTNELMWPPMSSIHVDSEELGRQAAIVLADWLDGERPPDITMLNLASWTERDSVGPPPAART